MSDMSFKPDKPPGKPPDKPPDNPPGVYEILLIEILRELKEIKKCVCKPKPQPQPNGVRFAVTNYLILIKGEHTMADLVLGQGQTAQVELHYVFIDPATGAITDLGPVTTPATVTMVPSDPSLGVAQATPGAAQAVLSNGNTTSTDINASLTGSESSFNFSTTIAVTVSGTSGPPPQQPNGVMFLIGTPSGAGAATPKTASRVLRR